MGPVPMGVATRVTASVSHAAMPHRKFIMEVLSKQVVRTDLPVRDSHGLSFWTHLTSFVSPSWSQQGVSPPAPGSTAVTDGST